MCFVVFISLFIRINTCVLETATELHHVKLNPGENLLNKCQGYLVDLTFLESKIIEKMK